MTRESRLVLAIAILASFVAFLDGSVVNVILPALDADLGGGLAAQQWVVDAYLITLGALILLAGSLSDLFGRIRILRAGLIGFGLASVAIALAPTAEFVIALRAVQGIAGALLVPSSLALILSTFRGPAQARAIGTWTAWTSAAFLAGPILGGALVDLVSWRAVFAINVVPIGVTLVLLAILRQPDVRRDGARIDVPGAILAVVGLGLPVYGLIEQPRLGWLAPGVLVPVAVGLAALVAFVWWQSRARHPMLPLGLFRYPNVAAGNLATAFIYAGLSISGFAVVVYLQQVAGFPPTLAALALLPVSVANVALSRVFGGLAGRFGPRIFMTMGPLLAAAGHLLLLSMGTRVDYVSQVLPGVLVFALGIAMTVAPLTAAVLGGIPEERAGIGSAVNNAVARIAGLLGIAAIGVVAAGALTAESFPSILVLTAVLLSAGGLVSLIGIRNPGRESASSEG